MESTTLGINDVQGQQKSMTTTGWKTTWKNALGIKQQKTAAHTKNSKN